MRTFYLGVSMTQPGCTLGLSGSLGEHCCLHPGPCCLIQAGHICRRALDGSDGPLRGARCSQPDWTLQGFRAVLSQKEGAPRDLSAYPVGGVGRNGYCFKILVHCFHPHFSIYFNWDWKLATSLGLGGWFKRSVLGCHCPAIRSSCRMLLS